MSVAFPLSPVPSTYVTITASQNHGVYYVGATAPAFTLSKTGATAYTVRDYSGNVVASGAVSGTALTPAAPAGGWLAGWYRLYLTGPVSDALFGTAYGSTNFAVIRNDARFPAIPAAAYSGGETRDIGAKGALGIGTSRLTIGDATNLTTGDTLAMCQSDATKSATYWNVASSDPYYDAARPRLAWCNFPNGAVDSLAVGALHLYCKDGTIDGSTVTVTAVVGTTSGTKLTVNGETYDNLATADAAVTAINAGSTLVKAFGSGSLGTLAATTVGRAFWNGVVTVVSTLYPLGVTRYEGPSNEPNSSAETAHRMRLFQAAVHAGNAAAKAIGPCTVDLNLGAFLAAGGGAWCDEISFHAYGSQVNGDINLGRSQLTAFMALLVQYGQSGKTLWQTESTNVFTSVYGVYHPRRARIALIDTLLWEQYGVPRERNSYWYDVSHGFWSYPAWWQNGDGSLNPHAVLYRTLAEETFGRAHAQTLDFGVVGNRVFLGSVYTGATGSTVVLVASSYMPGATVTLNVTGTTGALTTVDAFGNTATATITSGKAIVAVTDVPTYVRLPVGGAVTVATCNDWPTSRTGWLTSTGPATVTSPTVTPTTFVNDDKLMVNFGSGTGDLIARGTTVPDTVTLTWPSGTRLDRVILWAGVWQSMSTPTDFDIQTSNDGATWTTRATITRTVPASIWHGANANGTGCQYETYWDEQWIYDVKLPAPVSAKHVRLNVRATSYGGEPDLTAVTAGGQGWSTQFITLQEMAVLCDDNTLPHVATVT